MGSVEFLDTMLKDGLIDAFQGYHMGTTAENVAQKWQITRDEQDKFAVGLAEQGRGRGQGRPVQGRDHPGHHPEPQGRRGGRHRRVSRASAPPLDGMAKLRPAFSKDGTVTAGNASGINDGAAAVVLMTADEAKRRGLTPLARIVSWAQVGVDPAIMGTGPIPASRKALEKAGWTVDDLDLVEANEAFAAQAIAVNKDMGWDTDKVNVNGGAIALGHPIGASGGARAGDAAARDAASATPRRASPPCASAAAWASPCASSAAEPAASCGPRARGRARGGLNV